MSHTTLEDFLKFTNAEELVVSKMTEAGPKILKINYERRHKHCKILYENFMKPETRNKVFRFGLVLKPMPSSFKAKFLQFPEHGNDIIEKNTAVVNEGRKTTEKKSPRLEDKYKNDLPSTSKAFIGKLRSKPFSKENKKQTKPNLHQASNRMSNSRITNYFSSNENHQNIELEKLQKRKSNKQNEENNNEEPQTKRLKASLREEVRNKNEEKNFNIKIDTKKKKNNIKNKQLKKENKSRNSSHSDDFESDDRRNKNERKSSTLKPKSKRRVFPEAEVCEVSDDLCIKSGESVVNLVSEPKAGSLQFENCPSPSKGVLPKRNKTKEFKVSSSPGSRKDLELENIDVSSKNKLSRNEISLWIQQGQEALTNAQDEVVLENDLYKVEHVKESQFVEYPLQTIKSHPQKVKKYIKYLLMHRISVTHSNKELENVESNRFRKDFNLESTENGELSRTRLLKEFRKMTFEDFMDLINVEKHFLHWESLGKSRAEVKKTFKSLFIAFTQKNRGWPEIYIKLEELKTFLHSKDIKGPLSLKLIPPRMLSFDETLEKTNIKKFISLSLNEPPESYSKLLNLCKIEYQKCCCEGLWTEGLEFTDKEEERVCTQDMSMELFTEPNELVSSLNSDSDLSKKIQKCTHSLSCEATEPCLNQNEDGLFSRDDDITKNSTSISKPDKQKSQKCGSKLRRKRLSENNNDNILGNESQSVSKTIVTLEQINTQELSLLSTHNHTNDNPSVPIKKSVGNVAKTKKNQNQKFVNNSSEKDLENQMKQILGKEDQPESKAIDSLEPIDTQELSRILLGSQTKNIAEEKCRNFESNSVGIEIENQMNQIFGTDNQPATEVIDSMEPTDTQELNQILVGNETRDVSQIKCKSVLVRPANSGLEIQIKNILEKNSDTNKNLATNQNQTEKSDGIKSKQKSIKDVTESNPLEQRLPTETSSSNETITKRTKPSSNKEIFTEDTTSTNVKETVQKDDIPFLKSPNIFQSSEESVSKVNEAHSMGFQNQESVFIACCDHVSDLNTEENNFSIGLTGASESEDPFGGIVLEDSNSVPVKDKKTNNNSQHSAESLNLSKESITANDSPEQITKNISSIGIAVNSMSIVPTINSSPELNETENLNETNECDENLVSSNKDQNNLMVESEKASPTLIEASNQSFTIKTELSISNNVTIKQEVLSESFNDEVEFISPKPSEPMLIEDEETIEELLDTFTRPPINQNQHYIPMTIVHSVNLSSSSYLENFQQAQQLPSNLDLSQSQSTLSSSKNTPDISQPFNSIPKHISNTDIPKNLVSKKKDNVFQNKTSEVKKTKSSSQTSFQFSNKSTNDKHPSSQSLETSFVSIAPQQIPSDIEIARTDFNSNNSELQKGKADGNVITMEEDRNQKPVNKEQTKNHLQGGNSKKAPKLSLQKSDIATATDISKTKSERTENIAKSVEPNDLSKSNEIQIEQSERVTEVPDLSRVKTEDDNEADDGYKVGKVNHALERQSDVQLLEDDTSVEIDASSVRGLNKNLKSVDGNEERVEVSKWNNTKIPKSTNFQFSEKETPKVNTVSRKENTKQVLTTVSSGSAVPKHFLKVTEDIEVTEKNQRDNQNQPNATKIVEFSNEATPFLLIDEQKANSSCLKTLKESDIINKTSNTLSSLSKKIGKRKISEDHNAKILNILTFTKLKSSAKEQKTKFCEPCKNIKSLNNLNYQINKPCQIDQTSVTNIVLENVQNLDCENSEETTNKKNTCKPTATSKLNLSKTSIISENHNTIDIPSESNENIHKSSCQQSSEPSETSNQSKNTLESITYSQSFGKQNQLKSTPIVTSTQLDDEQNAFESSDDSSVELIQMSTSASSSSSDEDENKMFEVQNKSLEKEEKSASVYVCSNLNHKEIIYTTSGTNFNQSLDFPSNFQSDLPVTVEDSENIDILKLRSSHKFDKPTNEIEEVENPNKSKNQTTNNSKMNTVFEKNVENQVNSFENFLNYPDSNNPEEKQKTELVDVNSSKQVQSSDTSKLQSGKISKNDDALLKKQLSSSAHVEKCKNKRPRTLSEQLQPVELREIHSSFSQPSGILTAQPNSPPKFPQNDFHSIRENENNIESIAITTEVKKAITLSGLIPIAVLQKIKTNHDKEFVQVPLLIEKSMLDQLDDIPSDKTQNAFMVNVEITSQQTLLPAEYLSNTFPHQIKTQTIKNCTRNKPTVLSKIKKYHVADLRTKTIQKKCTKKLPKLPDFVPQKTHTLPSLSVKPHKTTSKPKTNTNTTLSTVEECDYLIEDASNILSTKTASQMLGSDITYFENSDLLRNIEVADQKAAMSSLEQLKKSIDTAPAAATSKVMHLIQPLVVSQGVTARKVWQVNLQWKNKKVMSIEVKFRVKKRSMTAHDECAKFLFNFPPAIWSDIQRVLKEIDHFEYSYKRRNLKNHCKTTPLHKVLRQLFNTSTQIVDVKLIDDGYNPFAICEKPIPVHRIPFQCLSKGLSSDILKKLKLLKENLQNNNQEK